MFPGAGDHGNVMMGVGGEASGGGEGEFNAIIFCFIMRTNSESLTPGNIWTLNRFCPALVPAADGAAEAIDLSAERGGGGEGLAQRRLG